MVFVRFPKHHKTKQLFGVVLGREGAWVNCAAFAFNWVPRRTHEQKLQEISGKRQDSPMTILGKSWDNSGQSRENICMSFLEDVLGTYFFRCGGVQIN